jgi:hypothetical protein
MGYVYKDRYTLISKFPSLIISKETETSITLQKDSLRVTITQSNFDKKKHTFKYFKDYPTQIELIDNKQYWGMDGGMLKTQFEKVLIKVGKKTITLPKSVIAGLYEQMFPVQKFNHIKQLTQFIFRQ